MAAASAMNLGQKGVNDGFESDSNGLVYAASFETKSIVTYSSQHGTVHSYVRRPVAK